MSVSRRNVVLRHVLNRVAESAPTEVTSAITGHTGPIDALAVVQLRENLRIVTEMHADGELSDAEYLAAVPQLATACTEASALRHMISPAQAKLARDRALDEKFPLTEQDVAALVAI